MHRPLSRPLTSSVARSVGEGGVVGNFGKSLLYKSSANLYLVFVPRAGTQMTLFEFSNNSTTTNNSLATTATDTTRFRLSAVRTAADVYVSQRTASATSGTFTNDRALGNTSPMQAWTTGTLPRFDSTVVSGAYKEYTLTPVNGRFNVTLRRIAAGSSSVTIKINGVDVETFSLAGSTALVTKTYAGYTGPTTVRVTNNTTSEMGICGVNFQTLRDYDGSTVDSVGWGRNVTDYADYLTNASSNDSVAKELSSGIYGGGYHGGETGITDQFLVNGAAQSLAVGGFAIGAVEIRTGCSVTWSGGGTMAWDTRWTFPLGSVQMSVSVAGNLRASEFYTTMGGFSTAFSAIDSPVSVDLAAAADNSRNALGNVGGCVLRNPTTSQRIASVFSTFDPAQNTYGGAHVWKVVGSYHKLYNGPVVEGDLTITALSFTTKHTFY